MGKEIPAIPAPPQTLCPLAPTAFWMCWGQLLSASTEQKQVPFLSWYMLLIMLVIKCCSSALGTTTARPGDQTAQFVYVWIYVNVPFMAEKKTTVQLSWVYISIQEENHKQNTLNPFARLQRFEGCFMVWRKELIQVAMTEFSFLCHELKSDAREDVELSG